MALRLLNLRRFFSSGASRTITAAVARKPADPFTLEKVVLRDIRHDEVLVRVAASGICHTDLAVKTLGLCSFPIVLGHEGTGVIERVGSSVRDFATGDHVIMTYASCGTCPHCMIAKPGYCFSHSSLNFAGAHPDGTHEHTFPNSSEALHGAFFQQSSFGTYSIASPRNIVKVDKDLPLHMLAPLGCGVQTGAGAVINTLQAKPGNTIAIFGCGAVGLSAVMAARIAGCSTIVAIDPKVNRTKLATALGATHTITPGAAGATAGKNEVVEQIKALTGHGIDLAIDTSGNPNVLRSAFDALKSMGTVGLIAGAAPGVCVSIDMLGLLPGKTLRGVIQGDSVSKLFIPQMIQWYRQGRFPFDKMVTYYENGLHDINKAVEESKHADVIKPVLKFAHH